MIDLNKKTMKLSRIIPYAPEVVFISVALTFLIESIVTAPTQINFIMIALIGYIILMMTRKIKTMAIVLSSVVSLLSIYMVFAVISEYSEFPSGSDDGLVMLIAGLNAFIILLILAVIMPFKYLKPESTPILPSES